MTPVLTALGDWLHATALGRAAAGGVPWLWAACETLHFIGLALLIGCVTVLDLRMLGVAKGLPLAPLQRLMPYAVLGFLINLATGVTFFAGAPDQYTDNGAFHLKILFIALAGANVALFYVSGVAKRIDALGAGEDAPVLAKMVAATSLFLWIGVMYWGRMLPFLGDAF